VAKAFGMIRAQTPASAPPVTASDVALLELATENAELRLQLAEAQEQCIEMAVDAGLLQVEIDALRREIALLQPGLPKSD
jgi:hypothetical protein